MFRLFLVIMKKWHIFNEVLDFWAPVYMCACSPKKHWKEKITTVCVSSSGHEKLGHLWARLQPCYREERLHQQLFPTARPIHSKQTTSSHKNTKNRDKWSKQSANEWLKRAGLGLKLSFRQLVIIIIIIVLISLTVSLVLFQFPSVPDGNLAFGILINWIVCVNVGSNL